MLTQQRLKEVLVYNPCSGTFRWRKSRLKAKAGKLAGCRRSDGYLLIKIDGRSYRAARLAWFYTYGEWPTEIDHINRDQTHDSIWNLRNATRIENVRNSSAYQEFSPRRWLGRRKPRLKEYTAN